MKGHILFNGNIQFEGDFIRRHSDLLLESHHVDPEVRKWRKVLLVTAAWQQREFEEGHIKEEIAQIGIPSRVEGGFEQNIQNLGVYHEFNRFREKSPTIYEHYHQKQEVVLRTKIFYRRKNVEFVAILRDQTKMMKETFPGVTLAHILDYDVLHHEGDLTHFDERELLFHYACQDVQDTLHKIRENDELMLRICRQIDSYFRDRSRVDENPTYIAIRDELRDRILSANSIVIFGGHMPVLLNRLRFFRLDDVFHEALNRGTNFYTISAGSMSLAEKVIVYDDFHTDEYGRRQKEFEFFDKGLGLVTKVQLFPHCMDRIQTDDEDNLSYLAHRFASGPCVGLNEESYLLVETVSDQVTGGVRDRFLSIGERDGVYVFDRTGKKNCRSRGEEVHV